MASSVSNADKRQFIRWFLKNYQLKRREGVWLLNYLLSSEQLLKRVKFTDDVHYCPHAIVMSTVETDGVPFRYYRKEMMTHEAEKVFYDLRQGMKEELYIQLNFHRAKPHPIYLAVIELNPYVPSTKPIRVIDSKIAEEVMEYNQMEFQEKFILNLIDRALDEGDEESFHQYVALLKKMNKR